MKITVERVVRANRNQVWGAWNNPADINQWNTRLEAILDNFARHVESKS